MDPNSITLWTLAAPTITAFVTALSAVAIHIVGQRRLDAREKIKRDAEEDVVALKNAWERDQVFARQLRDAATTLLVASNDFKRGRSRNMDVDEELALMRKLDEAHEQYALLAPDELEQLSAALFDATSSFASKDDDKMMSFRNTRKNLALATRRVLNELQPYPSVPDATKKRLAELGLYTKGDLVDPMRGIGANRFVG